MLQPDNFGLLFNPLLSQDSGEYKCLVNGRYSAEAIIDLVVQGKREAPEKMKSNWRQEDTNYTHSFVITQNPGHLLLASR